MIMLSFSVKMMHRSYFMTNNCKVIIFIATVC